MGHNSSRNQALLLSTQNSFSFSSFFSYKMKISYLFLILAGVIALGAVTAAREMEIERRDIAAPEDESKSLAEDPNGEESSLAQLTWREAFDRPPIDPDGEGYPAGRPISPPAGPPVGGSPGGSPPLQRTIQGAGERTLTRAIHRAVHRDVHRAVHRAVHNWQRQQQRQRQRGSGHRAVGNF